MRTILSLVLTLGLSGVCVAQTPARGTIIGTVTLAGTDLRLPYVNVSVSALSIERLSDEYGAFVLPGVPAGRVTLRVRRVGYAPVDIGVDVPVGDTARVEVKMSRIAVRLAEMVVRERRPCRSPGVPSVATDSMLAIVFAQFRLNAEQARLVLAEQPYNVAFRTTVTETATSGEERTLSRTTSTRSGTPGWSYKPGALVQRRRGIQTLRIPEIVHFASDEFVRNHCFWGPWSDVVGSDSLIRIDFGAADKLDDPDVDGSVWLDRQTLVLRRTELRLTKIPREVRGIADVTVTTIFDEVLPGAPGVLRIVGVTSYTRSKDVRVVSVTEVQETLARQRVPAPPRRD
jgi:hypothetical protein